MGLRLARGAPIRILVFSQYYSPETGALPARVRQHALRWIAAGHQVCVICQVPNYPAGEIFPGFRNRLFQRSIEEGIEVVRTGVIPRPTRRVSERLLNYISYALSAILAGLRGPKPDLILGSSPPLLGAWAGSVVARLRRVPFVFEVRDLWPESIEQAGNAFARGFVGMIRRLVVRLYRRSQHIVVVAEPFQLHLEQAYGVQANKISVIPNGVEFSIVDPATFDSQSVRKHYGFSDETIVAYVGGLGVAHGLMTMIDSAERLCGHDDILFVLVGDGPQRHELEQAVRDRCLSNVHFVGRKTWEEGLGILRAADISLVLLRRLEVFRTVIPTKLLEGMAMMRPIVLGVRGEAERILCEAKAGIVVEPEDAGALAAAISYLHEHRDEAERFGVQGREYVQEFFDREVMAQRMLSLFIKIAEDGNRSGKSM
jgi:glycosyltransferase involved in cell wall biosynthesis